MAEYDVRYQGKTYTLRGSRPPTREDMRRLVGQQAPPQTNEQKVEQRISERESTIPSAMSTNVDAVTSLFNPRENVKRFINPMKAQQDVATMVGRNIVAGVEAVESAPANAALALAQGRPKDMVGDFVKGISGKRVVERGDVARQFGAPEPVAAAIGLATGPEIMIPAIKGTTAAARGAKGFGKLMELGRPATLMKPNPVREQVVRKVQQRLLRAPKIASQEFEGGLDEVVKANPMQRVDLSQSMGSYLDKAGKNPAFRQLIERQATNNQESAFIQSLMNQPQMATDLTLQQSQMAKQIFQRVNKMKFQQVDPEFFGAHLDALEVWHDIRLAQLQAFPQFKQVTQGYAETMKNFRVIKNMLKEGALEPQLLNNFGSNSQRIEAFRELATPETMKLVGRFLKANSTNKFFSRLGVKVGGAALTGAAVTGGGVGVAKLLGVGRR